MSITSFPTFVPTTNPAQQSESLAGIQSTISTSSNATTAANNTMSNGNFKSGIRTVRRIHHLATASGTTPTSVQQFPGLYEDILLGLQLLAYLNKYPHARQTIVRGSLWGNGGNLWTKPDFITCTSKDRSYFKMFSGSCTKGLTIEGSLVSGASASDTGKKKGFAQSHIIYHLRIQFLW